MAQPFGNLNMLNNDDDDDDDSDDVDYVPSEHDSSVSDAAGSCDESGGESDDNDSNSSSGKRKRKAEDSNGSSSPSRKKSSATDEKRAAEVWQNFKEAVKEQRTKVISPSNAEPSANKPQVEEERKLPTPSENIGQTSQSSPAQVTAKAAASSTPTSVALAKVSAPAIGKINTLGVSQIKPSSQPAIQPPAKAAVASSSRLGSILSQIGQQKKTKSILEQSREHWEEFKSAEGISDELALHNRGSKGYLDRQDFLARVDSRQSEQLRQMRLQLMNKRRTT